jgi:hypothetical protein
LTAGGWYAIIRASGQTRPTHHSDHDHYSKFSKKPPDYFTVISAKGKSIGYFRWSSFPSQHRNGMRIGRLRKQLPHNSRSTIASYKSADVRYPPLTGACRLIHTGPYGALHSPIHHHVFRSLHHCRPHPWPSCWHRCFFLWLSHCSFGSSSGAANGCTAISHHHPLQRAGHWTLIFSRKIYAIQCSARPTSTISRPAYSSQHDTALNDATTSTATLANA